MRKLEKLLKGLKAQLLVENPGDDLGTFPLEFRSAVYGSRSEQKDALLCYQILSKTYRALVSPAQLAALKQYYAYILKYYLRKEPRLCFHYIAFDNEGITLPFENWEEEICTVANFAPRLKETWPIESSYFSRCRLCRRAECDNRIIRPEKNGPYWCTKDYHPNEGFDVKQISRQQKAQWTKEGDALREMERITRPICEELVYKQMAVRERVGVPYRFQGTSKLYAYIALMIQQRCNLPVFSWKAFKSILVTDAEEGALRTAASRLRENPENRPEGADIIDEIIGAIEHARR